jgi:hypothetical protein
VLDKDYLKIAEAEKLFHKLTQEYIIEEVDIVFCYDVLERVVEGLDSTQALEETVTEYGYHLKDDDTQTRSY